MDTGTSTWRRDSGTATLEFVGLAVAVAVLLGTVTLGLGREGPGMGAAVGKQVERLVRGDTNETSAPRARAQRRSVREKRWSGGRQPERVPRDELRMSPVVDPLAAWQRRWMVERQVGGIDGRIDGRACALCTALEWSHDLGNGASIDQDGGHVGTEATITGAARIAVAAADASIHATRNVGPAEVTGQGRVRGTIGAEAEGEARLRLSRTEQDLQLHGSAMAGAAAKAEGQVGVELLGIAIRHGGRAEGWAGAGARGTAGMRRTGTSVEWRFGWGAALGLGGAAEWSGSVDVSGVPARHRRLARRSLTAAIRAGLLFPPVLPLSLTR